MQTKQIQKDSTKKPEFVEEVLEKLTLLKTWPKYNLNTYKVWQKDRTSNKFEPTNYQRIEYNGRFVNYMSTMYNVLPNEDVKRTADLVAKCLEAKFMEPKIKFHDPKKGWCKPAGHVITNPEKTVMALHYQIGKPVDITGAKDFVEIGVCVKNAIDGKGGAFVVMPMTYRRVCDNVAYHVTQSATLHSGIKAHELQNLKGAGLSFNVLHGKDSVKLDSSPEMKEAWNIVKKAKSEFESVNFKKPHFNTLTLEYVTNAILTAVASGEKLMKKYKHLYATKVNLKDAQMLYDKLPKSVMTSTQISQWLEIDGKTKKLSLKKEVTNWRVFNDITNQLTFGHRNFQATFEAYAKLDEIMVRSQ